MNRAMDNGLTQPEAAEVLTHLSFYAGWPKVFSAMPVAREVFDDARGKAASGTAGKTPTPKEIT